MSKQGRGRKVTYFGIVFDSQIEGQRYLQLRSMEQEGEISDLICHPKFILIPAFTDIEGRTQRVITYTADFMYRESDKQLVVEDVKARNHSAKRPDTARIPKDGRLRIKLFKWLNQDIKFIVKVM